MPSPHRILLKTAFACYALALIPAAQAHDGKPDAPEPAEAVITPAQTTLPVSPPSGKTADRVPDSGKPAPDNRDAKTWFHLGMMAKNGYGVPADPAMAGEYFEKAAEQGYKPAIYQLALMQFSGTYGPQDKAAAIGLFGKLAGDGFAHAQDPLGYLPLKGDGIPPNPVEAKSWFEKAAAQNDVRATASVAWL